jgi:hypothetical protein
MHDDDVCDAFLRSLPAGCSSLFSGHAPPLCQSIHPSPGPRPSQRTVSTLCTVRRCAAFVPPALVCAVGASNLGCLPTLLCSYGVPRQPRCCTTFGPRRRHQATPMQHDLVQQQSRVHGRCAHLFPRAGLGAQGVRTLWCLAHCSGSTKNTRRAHRGPSENTRTSRPRLTRTLFPSRPAPFPTTAPPPTQDG